MLYKGRTPTLGNKRQAQIQVDEFAGGVNSLFSQTRLNKNEAFEALNLLLVEDGVWDKRWGTAAYGGVTWTNRPDGAAEYKKSDGTRQLIVIADGSGWLVDPVAETKTLLTGASFTSGNKCDFVQINDLLFVSNGVNPLARYNGSSFSTYTALSSPAWAGTPLTRGGGLSTGSYTAYYRVSAVNEIGETIPAAEQSITHDISRDQWDEADEYIDVDWAAVSGATKYIVYYSDTSGYEVKLDETTATAYRDDNSVVPNPYIEPPTDNTTTGPLFSTMAISNNRIWGCKDPGNPYRVYFSGTGVNLGIFSSAYGGGWVDLEKGGRATTEKVVDFQGVPKVFCKTDDGKGTIWNVPISSVTIGSETFTVPLPDKIITAIGTNAARSVVYVENDILFFNKKGVHVLGNEPGVLSVLRTNELSAKVRPYIRGLAEDSLENICAYYYDSKVFFSVPLDTGQPNRTIVFDRERTAWLKDWSIGVSQFLEYTDANGDTHLLGVAATKLIEFSDVYQGDDGTAFTWRYTSPRFPVATDWSEFARIRKAFIKLRNVNGEVDWKMYGTGKGQGFTLTSSTAITPETSSSGLGWDLVGDFLMGDSNGVPLTYTEQSLIRYMIINKLLRDVQLQVSGDGLEDRAVILGFRIEGNLDQTAKPLGWKVRVT